MAGDWIKMRLSLVTHPKVMRMAENLLTHGEYLEWAGLSYGMGGFPAPSDSELRDERYGALRVTRYITVTALLRFWGYANEHAKDDETIAGLWPDDVDEIAGVPKFSEALKHVAWIEFDDAGGCARLPNFCEHNVLAGNRSPAAERQKRYRENLKNRDVTRDVTVTPREEEIRVDKNKEVKALSGKPDAINGFRSQAVEVLDYLNRNAGREFRAVDANLKLIAARLKSGVTPLQCREVIFYKCEQWKADPKMCEYLRPKTLFNATNFENYLGELKHGMS